MEFTPRLMQILFLLLNADKPIPAAKLAEQLQISKRTIFRELDHIDSSLEKCGLKLERKSRTGFELTGDLQDKQRLLTELQKSDHFDPRNREERQQKLILAMMQEDELQKLFYYADMLQVSEPTVSKDLESLEEWFQRQNILLLRRAGFGVGLVYKEEDYRKALLAYASKYQDQSFIETDIYDKIKYFVKATGKDIIDKLTGYSVKNFLLYTAISIQRIKQHKYISELLKANEIQHPKNYEFIYNLAVIMEKEFKICIGKNEVYALYIFIQGCKYQYIQREGECICVGNEQINIKDMIYEMANAFDPVAAYELKDDADFMEGMIAHLQPTITRLVHRIPIKNPLLEQTRQGYPEIFEKAKDAAKVMERVLSCRMPEDEVGFLTLHFGGAMMRLDHKRRNRQIVNIGIVCSNGIGISILLSSKLRHHFGDQIRTEVVETRHIKNTDVDFLISTFPIDSKQESICVDPMLSEDDLNKISEKIEFFAWKEKKEKPQKNNVNVYEATLITNEINSIIKGFCFRYLPENISFTEALLKISDHFTEDTNKKEQLYKDFSEREALSTQVIEEFGIVFLHARTAVIEQSQFIVVLPEGDHFKDSYFKKTRAIIVMLIPEDDERRTLAVSSISNEMFEDEEFLEEIKRGQEEIVFPKIKNILEDYFNEYLRSVYNREG